MIVIDASVLSNLLGDDGPAGERARATVGTVAAVSAPDLVDVETVAVLRKRWLAGSMTAERFSAAIDDLFDLSMDRYPTLPLMRRAFELRANVTAYDATYIALAEVLGCPLLTADARLAAAPQIRCDVSLLRTAP